MLSVRYLTFGWRLQCVHRIYLKLSRERALYIHDSAVGGDILTFLFLFNQNHVQRTVIFFYYPSVPTCRPLAFMSLGGPANRHMLFKESITTGCCSFTLVANFSTDSEVAEDQWQCPQGYDNSNSSTTITNQHLQFSSDKVGHLFIPFIQ